MIKRSRPQQQRRHGFGLLEVMISATMLVLGLAGVLSFAAQTSGTAAHQRQITVAAHVAEIQLEKLVLLSPDDSRLTSGTHVGPRYDQIGNPSSTGKFQTKWAVTTSSPILGTRTVVVTVTWTEPTGTKTTTLKTIRT